MPPVRTTMAHEQHRKEINKPLAKPLSMTSGVLGMIQGVVWMIFAMLCILYYYDVMEVDLTDLQENEPRYYKVIYSIFLSFDNNIARELPDSRIVSQSDFVIFAWFYLVSSFLWTVVSGAIIWAMIHNQWHLTKGLFGSWASITAIISIIDIILMSLLVVDYIKIDGAVKDTSVRVCYGIMMTLAARGYVLWLINVIFAAIMTKYTLHVILRDNNTSTLPIIHGYENDNSVDPPWFNHNVKSFWANQNRPDSAGAHDNPAYQTSQSFVAGDHTYAGHASTASGNFYNVPSSAKESEPPSQSDLSPFAQAIANRTATLGKGKGGRAPLNEIPPPKIPDPDYTPPSSPKGKPVLRTKSNYSDYYY